VLAALHPSPLSDPACRQLRSCKSSAEQRCTELHYATHTLYTNYSPSLPGFFGPARVASAPVVGIDVEAHAIKKKKKKKSNLLLSASRIIIRASVLL
jgi:hypothetical protein